MSKVHFPLSMLTWPMKDWNGKLYDADKDMRETLDEIWCTQPDPEFYKAFYEGVKCGRIYEVQRS